MTQEPEPKEKSPLNEQIADIVLKVIMTGGVAGGGLGAFWSLLKESDVPKAIVSAVIGLGISYAAKMLLPVHEGTQRRLEKAGKAVDEALDDATCSFELSGVFSCNADSPAEAGEFAVPTLWQ